ncbi:acetyl-CoA C-acyltransferase [Ectothiorhodospira lacustris]|uniref:acetyl-CoA C-acyltransferase n=1 Tax=Ectothiorhodospira lacustris TaxID=2899127 RepID=UPI001EE8C100|nr:acetyl-CoA C-acyltransferase [Ectothiorhodospira lacustris]MCG5501844.1 acetyl-CoA C-acyltransferase [Ectothiorhodospira lacustris]MCG5509146.1 acetyl-CoA C-acyltransferase [Ectothiorhodospira lacustris]MCG5520936.1 acetyl-CoA C-acyltransferase [Ectothiorhodospira lacustris]
MSENAVYIVSALRTPVGKAPRGSLRHTRPDDLLAHVIRGVLDACPTLDPALVDDVVVGCAMPEGSQGLNVARVGALLAGLPDRVPGYTVNRFCASGLQAVALAADRIRLGESEVMIAAGTESMSQVPMMGHRPQFNPSLFHDEGQVGIAYGMGLTAEKVAVRWGVSREDQDAFALQSHARAVAAMDAGHFRQEILPVTVRHAAPDPQGNCIAVQERRVDTDEGPRPDTSAEALARLKPVFSAGGSVTPGNSSQMSDGAGAVLLVSERQVKALGLEPLSRFAGYAVAGVPAEIMGIGPVEAVPMALRRAGLGVQDLDWIELNEAFAAQSLAVMRELDLDPARVNPLGGAIALGHPLGATGAIRTATLTHGLRRTGGRYGMVTMCVGTGMGAAGIFERM